MANARKTAFDVLLAVDVDDAYANLLLPSRIRDAQLDPQDAGLATELTYGTLRWRGQYDALIEHLSGREIHEIDPVTRQAVRLGAHQLARTRIPSHAAVNETIDLLGNHKGRRGFANAVLRKISARPIDVQVADLAAGMNEDDALALSTSHPVWVVRALRRALAAEGAEAELEVLLHADNDAPRVQLVALPGLSEPEDLGDEPTASPLGRVAPAGDPWSIELVREGRARVQDAGSQLAALLVSRARPAVAGERWLDMCAGPGGKAALLAAEAARVGAKLEANESSPARTRLVKNALAAIEPMPNVVTGDGRRYGAEPPRFDRVLVDAPCTGLGALRRRPEARWRKQPSDVPALAALQSALLASAANAVVPGGLVAFVTCSPHLAETRAIVQRTPGLRPLASREIVERIAPGIRLGDSGTAVQLWPHRNGTDAMFMQLFERE